MVTRARAIEKVIEREAADVATDVATRVVQEKLEEQGIYSESGEEVDDELLNQPISPIKQPTKGVFDSFLSSLGFFGKISKALPDGGWETKDYTINNPESIPDIDQFIVSLVNEKGWGDGKYFVTIRHPAKKGFHLKKQVIVGELTAQEKRERVIHKTRASDGGMPGFSGVDPVESGLKITDKVLSVAKSMTPPQADMAQMSGVIADTFKAGVEAIKTFTPVPNPPQDGTQTIIQVISALKDIFKPLEPKQDDLIKTLGILKEIGVISPPIKTNDDAFMHQLKVLREGLGLKFAHEMEGKQQDPMAMVEKVGALISVLRPLVNPESGPPSTVQLIFEAFSKFGGPLFDTIRDFAEAKKMEVQHRIASAGGTLPATVRRTVERPLAPPPNLNPDEGPKNMNAILNQIVTIVKTKDESKFSFLRETIFGFLGPHWVEGLISGNISVDYIITLSKLQFGNAFDNEDSKLYLYKFVSWLRERKGETREEEIKEDVAGGDGVINARCPSCKQDWKLTNEEWAENQLCECGTKLEILQSAGGA